MVVSSSPTLGVEPTSKKEEKKERERKAPLAKQVHCLPCNWWDCKTPAVGNFVVSTKLPIQLPLDPVVLFLGIYICSMVLRAPLFAMEDWKPPMFIIGM